MSRSYTTAPVYSLKLVREKGVRYQVSKVQNGLQATTALLPFLQDRPVEHLAILMLDNQHHCLGMVDVAMGGITGLHIQVRDVFTPALLHRAHAIILAHNHPSGDVSPSAEDMHFTQQCVQASKVLGCPVLDHIIVSSGLNRGTTYGFVDHGVMPS